MLCDATERDTHVSESYGVVGYWSTPFFYRLTCFSLAQTMIPLTTSSGASPMTGLRGWKCRWGACELLPFGNVGAKSNARTHKNTRPVTWHPSFFPGCVSRCSVHFAPAPLLKYFDTLWLNRPAAGCSSRVETHQLPHTKTVPFHLFSQASDEEQYESLIASDPIPPPQVCFVAPVLGDGCAFLKAGSNIICHRKANFGTPHFQRKATQNLSCRWFAFPPDLLHSTCNTVCTSVGGPT